MPADDKSDEPNRSATNNSDNIISKLFGLSSDGGNKSATTTTTLKPIVLNKKLKKYDSTQTIVEESIEDIDKLRVQLEQEDCRSGGREGGSRLRRGMRKISTSSKNLLEKRKHVFGKKTKCKRPSIDSNEEESSSLMGSAQEIYRVSPSNSLLDSLTDIRGKLKIKPKHKYQRAKSDGVAMAALLVRSMMVTPTALDCIDEADSPKSSVKSQSIEPIKSGSMSNLSSGNAERNIYLKPTMAYTAAHLKISDSNLSSNFSESSCTISTGSSDGNGDEDCSESEETTQNDILLVDADTVSMVVKSVLAHEQSERNKDDWIEPKNVLEQQQQQLQRNNRCVDEIKMSKTSNKRNDSIDGEMDPDMLKALMISPNDDDDDAANWIQPGSTADEPECLPEKRRGSVFHELKENISEKIHHLQEHIHFPHHRHNTDEVKNRHGLLATALDTILIEQANILGAQLPTVQPEIPEVSKEKLDMSKRRSSIDAIRKKIAHSFQKRLSISEKSTKNAATIATQTDNADNPTEEGNNFSPPTKEYVLSAPFLSLNDLEQIDANEMNKMSYGSAMEFGSIKEAAQPFISLTDLYTVHDSDSNSCLSIIQPSHDVPKPQPPLPPPSSNPSLNPLVVFENLTNNNPVVLSESNNFSCVNSFIKNELINSTTTSVTITTTNNDDKNNVVVDDADNDARCDLLISNTNKAFLLTPFPNPNHHRSETVATTATTIASPNTKIIATVVSGHIRAESTGGKMSQSPAKNTSLTTSQTTPTSSSSSKEPVCRRSSDSDLNVTPKGKIFTLYPLTLCFIIQLLSGITIYFRKVYEKLYKLCRNN